jgi:hypothetical protein
MVTFEGSVSHAETQTLLIGLSLALAVKPKRSGPTKIRFTCSTLATTAGGRQVQGDGPDTVPPDMTPFEVPVSASASDVSVSRRGIARATSSHLRPEDAVLQSSPPYRSTSKNRASDDRRKRDNRGNRNASRRRPRTWKKLLWVKQACMKRAAAREAIYQSSHAETVRSRQLHG